MNIIDKTVIKRFHQMRTQSFGEGTSQALGWRNDDSQLSRFGMLAGIGNMNGRTVLDAGCGYGDLSQFLYDRYPTVKYSGIDQSDEFLAIATTRYAHLPYARFYMGDFTVADLASADYVLASGSLSYHTTEPDFVYKMISKLFSTANIAFGFNLLSKVKNPDGILVAYNPKEVMTYCLTITDRVVLHNDYCDGDFTVWMYH